MFHGACLEMFSLNNVQKNSPKTISFHCVYCLAGFTVYIVVRVPLYILSSGLHCIYCRPGSTVYIVGVITWLLRYTVKQQIMGNFVHTAFKAYCGVLFGPVLSATCDIGINTINSLVNVVKFTMDD